MNYSQLLKPVPLLSTILISMISINSYAAVNKESVDGEAQRFQTNMTSGVTDVGANIFDLHMFVLWVCVIIGVLTFGVMFYSLFRYRKTAGHKPATFHEHLGAEITWTIIPVFILAALAWPAITTLKEISRLSLGSLIV